MPRLALILLVMIGLSLTTGRAGATTAPAGVTLTYAFVPKDRLAEAVKGRQEALEIEAAWRKAILTQPGPVPHAAVLANTKYSIVVFIENPPHSAIWGKVGIPVQNPRNPVVLNFSLAPGYHGTYVIDGGGLVLFRLPDEPKPFEWLEVHTH
jgi:hypothetical protein